MNIGGCASREFPSQLVERIITGLMVTSILDRMGMGMFMFMAMAMDMVMATTMEETGPRVTYLQKLVSLLYFV